MATWKASITSVTQDKDTGNVNVAVTYTDGVAVMTDVLLFDERVVRASIEFVIADRVALLEGMSDQVLTEVKALEGVQVGAAPGLRKFELPASPVVDEPIS